MADHEKAPSAAQLPGVLDLLERLRERPAWRRRERLRPLLFLLGPPTSTKRVAEAFGQRCARERAPVSRIAENTEETDIAGVLHEAKRELSRRHPRREPALRFPLLEMALWLRELRTLRELRKIRVAEGHEPAEDIEDQEKHRLVHELTETARAEADEFRRRELAQAIRRRNRKLHDNQDGADRGRFAAFLTHLDQVAPIGVAVVALLSLTAASTLDLAAAVIAAAAGLSFVAGQILIRTRGWFALRRYGWFLRQKYMPVEAVHDFLGFALELIDPSWAGGRERDERLDRLLVAAFLEDLRRSYQRGIRRAAWARVRYPVLIFDHLTTGHIGGRFIELVEQVRARSQAEGGQPDFDPLVIAAGIDPSSPADAVGLVDSTGPKLVDRLARSIAVERADDTPADLEQAATLWRRHTIEQRRVGTLGSRRELRVDLTKGHDGDFDQVRDQSRPARRRPWAAHPVLPWIAMVAVLVPSVQGIVLPRLEDCEPPAVWRGDNGECVGITDGSYPFDTRLRGVEQRIGRLNDDVLRSGKPYITIVYLGPLTPDPTTKNPQQDLLASAQGELVGLSIAQQRHNSAGSPLRLQILVANTGSKMRYAGQVASQIRTLALEDRHVVGVVGFEQSRRQTQQAINVISQAAVPMIGTANSFDGTAKQGNSFSPYYFRLAPPNRRLAGHAAHWARSGSTGIRAKTTTVFFDGDPEDLYSKNLAQDFSADFGRDRVTTLSYTDPSQVPGLVKQACTDPSDLFYYAGRSDEFRSFVNQLTNTACDGRRIVLADDEIAKYVNDNAAEIGRNDAIRLFYTPLALREAWTPQWVGKQPLGRFFSDYDDVVAEVAGKNAPPNTRPSSTRAAVSYDAALVFASVAAQVYGDQRSQPTPAAILAALIEPENGARLQGASGVLGFGSRATGHQVDDKPVLLATVRPGGAVDVLAVCGHLVMGDQGPADCPASDR